LRGISVTEKEEAKEEWRELQNTEFSVFYSRHIYKDYETY
jgi:hypothetical protein